MSSNETEKSFSRRNFLKMSGMATGTLVAGTYLGTLLKDDPTQPESPETATEGGQSEGGGEQAEETPDYGRAYKFFQKQEDFATIEAAAERIFPEDDNGPGAASLGIAWFIDHELAGGYGSNSREYMKGPFKEGTDYQGPQYAMVRREIFSEGIRVMNAQAEEQFDAQFAEIEGDQQDEILTQMEQDDIEIPGLKASDFFEELRLVTLSGAYADPLYGGNIKMKGWEMKKFPGAYMSYANEIEQDGFIDKETQPLSSHVSH
ncbi:MAG TPA: gluconate 2-dehydrogenase subunit 3 family protein [Candidatus Salinicoccus stercoripullorum]|uniref:Gluconate 2-dehydrogenase subunit 3 family protein n=1 Tax=Candidatus Salinicoccus stercoripullorum TaxID=2838756 RepID=A0A9D1QFQ7_9STAP|nr:gluconate 2-dehydrogenase subunit 3 family protein [Candidatus Salinicoccus stercoripullorum]